MCHISASGPGRFVELLLIVCCVLRVLIYVSCPNDWFDLLCFAVFAFKLLAVFVMMNALHTLADVAGVTLEVLLKQGSLLRCYEKVVYSHRLFR